MTKGQVNMWHNDYYDGDSVYWVDEDDKFFELYIHTMAIKNARPRKHK